MKAFVIPVVHDWLLARVTNVLRCINDYKDVLRLYWFLGPI